MKKKPADTRALLDRATLEVAELSISERGFPEAGIHYARLLREGFSSLEAKRMIGSTLSAHVALAKYTKRPVDQDQLLQDLASLPDFINLETGAKINTHPRINTKPQFNY